MPLQLVAFLLMCSICELGTVAPALRLLQVLVTVALDLRADPQNRTRTADASCDPG